ncbi:hypothetical protein [Nesterenkonia ebinurensis]|uniref:hypothetical protein n=1 Tax=Nesterenkonia ebinurensis TaxID=2608252 RepID=UPI001CC81CB4|nr:hypothetical protein [Nesterenkonia ebinurensis]
MGQRIYVETLIRAPLEQLWEHTQDPAVHAQWDLRFGQIVPTGHDAAGQKHFRYATTVLPGVTVAGTGVHAGQRRKPDGSATSALRFGSEQRLCLIKSGSGYWRYIPQHEEAVSFLTGYDYTPRWGWAGELIDSMIFRPTIGWATAFSFDRLRLWLECGITPTRSRNQAVAEAAARALVVGGVVLLINWKVGLAAGAAAVLVPPLPSTAAARRCRRRPTGQEPRVDVSALGKDGKGAGEERK